MTAGLNDRAVGFCTRASISMQDVYRTLYLEVDSILLTQNKYIKRNLRPDCHTVFYERESELRRNVGTAAR